MPLAGQLAFEAEFGDQPVGTDGAFRDVGGEVAVGEGALADDAPEPADGREFQAVRVRVGFDAQCVDSGFEGGHGCSGLDRVDSVRMRIVSARTPLWRANVARRRGARIALMPIGVFSSMVFQGALPMTPPHLVVTDLDGTLLGSASRLGGANRRALEALGRNGTVRVVATGRSLYSARTVMPADFPIDYLVFSSGAGVVSWADERLLRSRAMAPPVVSGLVARLRTLALDFMVHHAVPDTHCFHFFRSTCGNTDFERRIERYAPLLATPG